MGRASVCGLLGALLLPLWCAGQGVRVYTIDTVVGGAVYDNRPALQTPLNFPTGLWLDREGGLWVADRAPHGSWPRKSSFVDQITLFSTVKTTCISPIAPV